MSGQDVQHDTGGMDVVRQSLGTSGLYRIDPIGQHGAQDVDHLPVTAGLTFQLAPRAADRHRQVPLLERCPVAQSAGLASQNGYVMQGIKDGLAATEGTLVLTNDLAILPTFQPISIGADIDGPPDRTGIDRVSVVVEPDQAGFGDGGRNRVESI